MTMTVTEGQSLVDAVLQVSGDLSQLFALADANELSITDGLTAGQVLAVPATAVARPEVVSYYAGRSHRVNTGSPAPVAAVPPTLADFDAADFTTDFDI